MGSGGGPGSSLPPWSLGQLGLLTATPPTPHRPGSHGLSSSQQLETPKGLSSEGPGCPSRPRSCWPTWVTGPRPLPRTNPPLSLPIRPFPHCPPAGISRALPALLPIRVPSSVTPVGASPGLTDSRFAHSSSEHDVLMGAGGGATDVSLSLWILSRVAAIVQGAPSCCQPRDECCVREPASIFSAASRRPWFDSLAHEARSSLH